MPQRAISIQAVSTEEHGADLEQEGERVKIGVTAGSPVICRNFGVFHRRIVQAAQSQTAVLLARVMVLHKPASNRDMLANTENTSQSLCAVGFVDLGTRFSD